MKYHYNSIGHFESITDSNGHELYRTAKTTAMGQTERFVMGGDMVSEREYHPEKHTLTRIHTAKGENILQDLWYDYDGFGNLAVRKDNMRDLEERFAYDHLNRLTGITLNGSLTGDMGYDPYGRMKNKVSDNALVFSAAVYDRTSKPHAIDAAKTLQGVFPAERQRITYTCFDKVKTIKEGGKTLEYAYGYDRQRTGMTERANGVVRTKRYAGRCEFVTRTEGDSTSRVIYTFLTGPTGVFAVVETLGDGKHYPHYVLKDHLGSWTTITDANGTVEREQSFDAWGNLRNPETWTGTVTQQPMFDRGFTGHEHIATFGLINMNGRCYDPVTSSFLSVDAYVQSPDNSQSFNRYSYCQNNPLKYTDPTGWQLVGGTRPRPQGFYDKWGDYYSRPAYEPRDFGILQLSDVNPDIAWMEANDMRGGVRNETLGGGSPIYDEHGYFLGTDDGGLQGVAIVMRREDFRQGMKHDDALALAVDLDDNDQDAEIRFYMHYSQLCNRPDWDGYLTLSEANEWYRDGSGEPLFADLSQIDLSSIASYGERQVGKRKTYNLLWYGNPITDGLVYGNITLKYYPDHIVRAYADLYDFDMKPWRNPLNWGRNIETMIGNKVAGNGTPFNIYFYGSYQLTPILPWIK